MEGHVRVFLVARLLPSARGPISSHTFLSETSELRDLELCTWRSTTQFVI